MTDRPTVTQRIDPNSPHYDAKFADLRRAAYAEWNTHKADRRQALATILAHNSATVRKFQLIKCFADLLPANAKTLSAADLAAIVQTQLA